MTQNKVEQTTLTGRLQAPPHALLHAEILSPQFHYELKHMLPWYLLIEKVLLVEYGRMGLIEPAAVIEIGALLDQITPEVLVADPVANMSDIAFALEQYVEQRLKKAVSNWHVDRSRNDFQACAQLMFAREQLFATVEELFPLLQAIDSLAERHREVVMPGYTHYQAAQVISPAFYLSAFSSQLLSTARRLLAVYDDINTCPLGAGAMAGVQLPWDRSNMAQLLGFTAPQPHALIAVASRDWLLQIAGELSQLSVVISRVVTDFISWGSSEYAYIDLPDELSGISSAMPQKKNFPIFERIRGKTAHISAFAIDFLLGQRNTPYTNLVEVSKEASSQFHTICTTTQTVLRLLTIVIERLSFCEARMKTACQREHLSAFTLANLLTLEAGIPYRKAQTIVGRYIVQALEQELDPWQIDSELLRLTSRHYGYELTLADATLQAACQSDLHLQSKTSAGSTHPQAVRELLAHQRESLAYLQAAWLQRRTYLKDCYQDLNRQLVNRGEEIEEC